jgi:hypothetical protein
MVALLVIRSSVLFGLFTLYGSQKSAGEAADSRIRAPIIPGVAGGQSSTLQRCLWD